MQIPMGTNPGTCYQGPHHHIACIGGANMWHDFTVTSLHTFNNETNRYGVVCTIQVWDDKGEIT